MTRTTHRNLWNVSSLDYDSLFSKYETIKNVVLYLDSQGYNRTEIGSYLGKSPQHISNILNVKDVASDHAKNLAKYRSNTKK